MTLKIFANIHSFHTQNELKNERFQKQKQNFHNIIKKSFFVTELKKTICVLVHFGELSIMKMCKNDKMQ